MTADPRSSDPRAAQREAADPKASIFVTANAGSGKTTTLVDRVARLLLGGSEPEAILCVTYTKAAAAEMQRRLFQRLGDWSVTEDKPLRERLAELQDRDVEDFTHAELSAARALFARALETPGGLKIQTIHAFCEKLLKRFPLEAGVSPGFKVMDDRDAAEIAHEARETMAGWVQAGPSRLADAYSRLSVALAFDDFQAMFVAFETRRAAIADYLERCGGEAAADVWACCGFDGPTSETDIEAEALAGIDFGVWRAAAEALNATSGANDSKCASKLLEAAEARDFGKALEALFTEGGDGPPATIFAKSKAFNENERLREALLADQDHLAAARERRCAARIAEDTVHALILAQAYVEAYASAKRVRGALDFADLILKTCELLTRRADAAWVLYKLDGGIDHILVDEAQDTAPEQWAILRALTSEFFAGAGGGAWRMDLERTLFIVGDEKQSIYSFQGADPDRLRVDTAE
jgi:ATP-dependent helicase/nuclease subunit A